MYYYKVQVHNKINSPQLHTRDKQHTTNSDTPSPACIASVRVHSTPSAASIPRYGGSPVKALNAGTDNNPDAYVRFDMFDIVMLEC